MGTQKQHVAMLRLSVFLCVALMGGVCWDFTQSQRYKTWVADLKPGFMVTVNEMDGRRCYCKVPIGESSSSFSFNPNGVLSSTPLTSSSFDFHFLTMPPALRNVTK